MCIALMFQFTRLFVYLRVLYNPLIKLTLESFYNNTFLPLIQSDHYKMTSNNRFCFQRYCALFILYLFILLTSRYKFIKDTLVRVIGISNNYIWQSAYGDTLYSEQKINYRNIEQKYVCQLCAVCLGHRRSTVIILLASSSSC